MIEKVFDKSYTIKHGGVSKSALTRAANRMLKEYAEAIGTGSVPDELAAVAENIKRGEDSEEYEFESSNEYGGTGNKVYDTVRYTTEARAHSFWSMDEYLDPIYNVMWYFFTSELYKKRIAGKTILAGSHTELLKKVTAAKGKYRYFCTHRPPSPGCVPKGYVSYDTYSQGYRYIGEVTYNEEPSKEELRVWGLVPDQDWEQMRRAYMEITA